MTALRFEVLARDPSSRARVAVIHTHHGPITTPAFAPVGTLAAVKGLSPPQVEGLGVQIVMSNAYHLAMRPGAEAIEALGGLHRIAGWSGPMMTDSGGFQVFSMEDAVRVDPDGVTFQAKHDGGTHRFTPESVVELQLLLGADLAMPLDLCTKHPASRRLIEDELEVTLDWAARAREAHERRRGSTRQALYGIVQGSVHADLRARAAQRLAALDFEAYAVGGVSVGESKAEMRAAVSASVPHLPEGAPRHLLGVGHPEDILDAVALGMDTFDCVMPTRNARTAGALTMDGRMNLRNSVHKLDDRPIDPGCTCLACQRFSRGAIRHFCKAGEILGPQLLTVHNLHFILELMRGIRAAIREARFEAFRRDFLQRYAGGAYADAAVPR